jgi:hypothetical protein
VKCFDEDYLDDDLIGDSDFIIKSILPPSNPLSKNPHESWITLLYKKKKSAEILIRANFIPYVSSKEAENAGLFDKNYLLAGVQQRSR